MLWGLTSGYCKYGMRMSKEEDGTINTRPGKLLRKSYAYSIVEYLQREGKNYHGVYGTDKHEMV